MNSEALPIAGLAALALLAVRAHAVRGPLFALVWTLVPAAHAAFLVGSVARPSWAPLAAALHLGLLLAKGAVETTALAGRTAPFVAASALGVALAAAPALLALSAPRGPVLLDTALAGAWLSLCYRIVSRFTERDALKLPVLVLLAPVAAWL